MSRKIARITQDKELLLANKVVEGNTKIRLDSDGRLDVDEIIEYPAELEGGRNLIVRTNELENYWITINGSVSPCSTEYVNAVMNDYIAVMPGEVLTFTKTESVARDGGFFRWRWLDGDRNYIARKADSRNKFQWIVPDNAYFIQVSYPKDAYPKIEKGSQATPWTPAPEDLGLNYPDSIQNFNSSISGNNIITPEFIEGYPFVKPVIDDSLVLWFDGSTGNNYEQTRTWKDLSGNGNDGQLVNFGYIEGSGWVDGGLRFDGVDDYVNTGFRIEGFNNYTISITFKFISYEEGVASSIIRSGGTAGRIMMVGNILGYLTINTWFGSGMDFWHNGSYKITVDEIVNMVATFDRQGFQRMYINGEMYGEKDISSAKEVPWNGTVLNIGKPDSYYKNTNIEVYDCKIYNRVLTDEEILQNYQAGQCSPLLAMRGDV